jgi:hypothetical protein
MSFRSSAFTYQPLQPNLTCVAACGLPAMAGHPALRRLRETGQGVTRIGGEPTELRLEVLGPETITYSIVKMRTETANAKRQAVAAVNALAAAFNPAAFGSAASASTSRSAPSAVILAPSAKLLCDCSLAFTHKLSKLSKKHGPEDSVVATPLGHSLKFTHQKPQGTTTGVLVLPFDKVSSS